MVKRMFRRLGKTGWFLAGATTAIVALALVGVAIAALGSPPQQQPTPTPIGPETYPPGVFPPGFDPTPPPTVFPSDFWGPRERVVDTGPTTAGTQLGIGDRLIQLPPNVYVKGRWDEALCAPLTRCPQGGGVLLALLDGDSTITVSGRQIWDPRIAPGEEGVFDWLYRELGVAKGSEMWSGPIKP